MSDSPAPRPLNAALAFAAVGAGLVVVMLLAAFMPRTGAEEGVSWTVTLGGGLAATAVVYAVGAMRKGGRTTKVEPPR